MNLPSEHIDELIALVLCGEATPAQVEELAAWRAAAPEQEQYFREMEKLMAIPDADQTPVDVEAAWLKVSSQLETPKEAVIRKMNMNWWQMAAAAVVVFMIGFYWYSTLPENEIEIASAHSILHDTLPDGSAVVLNAESTIAYQEHKGVRKVWLSGEGYFKVKHVEELPFEVEVMDVIVRDIGTAFNVRSNSDSELVEVIVDEGVVELDGPEFKMELRAGEGAIYRKGSAPQRFTLRNYNASSYATGKLQFVNAKMEEVAAVLEKTFNVDIEVEESIRQCALTADFSGEKLDTILEILAATMQIEIRKEGNVIHLTGKGCI